MGKYCNNRKGWKNKAEEEIKGGECKQGENSMTLAKRRWAKEAERRGRGWGRKAKNVRVHLYSI